MSALTATTELALATGAPIAVAMLNPRASHHLGVIGAGVVAGAFVGRMSVGVLLPPEGQTETNDAIGALLGGALGGLAVYYAVTRGERAAGAKVKRKTKRR